MLKTVIICYVYIRSRSKPLVAAKKIVITHPVCTDVGKTHFRQRSPAGKVACSPADAVDPQERVVAGVALRVEARRLVLALRSGAANRYDSLNV